MIELLEYVTEEAVSQDRTEKTAPFIRRFFADAGTNRVRAFNDRHKNCGGYIFFENGEESGRYFMFVTIQINPNPDDANRFKRQFSDLEWFSGTFAGSNLGSAIADGDIGERE